MQVGVKVFKNKIIYLKHSKRFVRNFIILISANVLGFKYLTFDAFKIIIFSRKTCKIYYSFGKNAKIGKYENVKI